MMYAAVDLGSNSFRLHVGATDVETVRIVRSAREPVRLGAGLDAKGCLTDTAQKTAIDCLLRFRAILSEFQLDAVRVVATNTLRVARNAAVFLPAAEKAIGYPIEVISGEEEGRLIYMGVTSALARDDERRLVIDIGGGSTELIVGHGQQVERVESFSIGTVKQSQAFFGSGRIDAASFDSAIFSARSYFEDGAATFHPRHWSAAYGSSGTIRAISEAIEKNKIGDGGFNALSLQAFKEYLIGCGMAGRVQLTGFKPERLPAMLGGLAILIALMQEIGFEEMRAVDAGLRMGLLRDLQLRAVHQDRREQSSLAMARRFHVDPTRAARAAQLAAAIHEQLKPESDAYAPYLRWSALLHEVGMAVSHTGHHKHGAYLVENADLPGFTAREQRLVGRLILAQKGNLRKVGEQLSEPDFAKAVLALRLAAILMHSRAGIDVAGWRFRMKGKVEIDTRGKLLQSNPTIAYWLEKEAGFWEEAGVAFSVRSSG